MSYDVSSMLLHSADVPSTVKAELIAARAAPVAERESHLRSAARALVLSTPLACDEARELVGLPPGSC